MRSTTDSAPGRATPAGRRSVEFATIDEEPVNFSLRSSRRSRSSSDFSITLDDDIEPHGTHENKSSVELQHHLVDRQAALSGHTNNSRQRSSQIASTIRRLTRSRFLFNSTESEDADGNSIHQSHASNQAEEFPMQMGGFAASINDRRGRTTIFTRPRRSLGTRSSGALTSSGSTVVGVSTQSHPEAYCVSDAKIHALRCTIGHPAWKLLTLIFILALLFGPPIRDIWLPKTADDVMDSVFTICFAGLAVDILMRSVVDKSYFSCRRKDISWSNHHVVCKCWNSMPGSFVFWFDLVALLTVLYNIEYINPRLRRPVIVQMVLNERGFPTNGRHSNPTAIDWPLMITLGRVGLMARFLRTTVLGKLADNFHWIRFFHHRYWWKKLTSKCRHGIGRDRNQVTISQRVLTGSSRGREGLRDSDPYSVSALGDSGGRSMRDSSRRFSATELDVQSEPFSEEGSESVLPDVGLKHTTIKDFFKGLSRKASCEAGDSLDGAHSKGPAESLLFGDGTKDSRSHVGAAMRELTGQRVATSALLVLLVTVVCNWSEDDTTNVMTMLTLHGQTANTKYAQFSVNVARQSVIPSLFNYTRANSSDVIFSEIYGDVSNLRERQIMSVWVNMEGSNEYTSGQFDNSQSQKDAAKVELVTEIIILFLWTIGVASFAGPVMTLVVEPIERMVRLLSMLMKDPLGYQNTPQYRKLKYEDEDIADNSMWSKEVLKGMETNFLMSTILRIGSLMKVGFGSAGAEIIRNNLERGRHKDVLFLSKQGSNVSCIFLFCDIRQFTDATECLQEEVFVFTNKIAAVVHSICHSYGGSANKNIGDAFLVSWLLDEGPNEGDEVDETVRMPTSNFNLGQSDLFANSNQADKALLSVVKISMALHYDNYYVEDMNKEARDRLLSKLSRRKGPIVQMGFGLHAGKAVQGAIGSQRKLDATYISESVERAEFLESSTKQYGVPLLMSDAFYKLLDSSTRLRCRKIDQLLLLTGEEGDLSDPHEIIDTGEKMSIYTFDMDIDALWRTSVNDDDNSMSSNSDIEFQHRRSSFESRRTLGAGSSFAKRRSSIALRASFARDANTPSSVSKSTQRRSSLMQMRETSKDVEKAIQAVVEELAEKPVTGRKLVLPVGVTHFSKERAWLEPAIKTIRRDYVSNGIIFPKYQEGLKAYYAKDWTQAKQCFETVISQRYDGPSHYFLNRMAEHDGVPPSPFVGYHIIAANN